MFKFRRNADIPAFALIFQELETEIVSIIQRNWKSLYTWEGIFLPLKTQTRAVAFDRNFCSRNCLVICDQVPLKADPKSYRVAGCLGRYVQSTSEGIGKLTEKSQQKLCYFQAGCISSSSGSEQRGPTLLRTRQELGWMWWRRGTKPPWWERVVWTQPTILLITQLGQMRGCTDWPDILSSDHKSTVHSPPEGCQQAVLIKDCLVSSVQGTPERATDHLSVVWQLALALTVQLPGSSPHIELNLVFRSSHCYYLSNEIIFSAC